MKLRNIRMNTNMKMVIGFYVLLYCKWICSITARSDVVSRQYKRNNNYSDKVLTINQTSTTTVASLRVCSSLCRQHGACFGYHAPSNLCRVYPSCKGQDITDDEPGWTYYEEDINCNNGWLEYNGHCYFRNASLMNQPEAMSTCNLYGGYLVEINDAEENEWISHILLKDVYCIRKFECTSGTGANDRTTEGVFLWEHSGTPVSYTNWDSINPDNHVDPSKPLDCVDLFYTGEWNDRSCAYLAAFVCEK